jgi:hypothetical protein
MAQFSTGSIFSMLFVLCLVPLGSGLMAQNPGMMQICARYANIYIQSIIAASYKAQFLRFSDGKCYADLDDLERLVLFLDLSVETAQRWMEESDTDEDGKVYFRDSRKISFRVYDLKNKEKIKASDITTVVKKFIPEGNTADALIEAMRSYYGLRNAGTTVSMDEFVSLANQLDYGEFCTVNQDSAQMSPIQYFEMSWSESSIYYLSALLCIVLFINVLFITYMNCCSSSKKKQKYSKVKSIVSSDDDMQHLKEYKL